MGSRERMRNSRSMMRVPTSTRSSVGGAGGSCFNGSRRQCCHVLWGMTWRGRKDRGPGESSDYPEEGYYRARYEESTSHSGCEILLVFVRRVARGTHGDEVQLVDSRHVSG